MTFLNDAGTNIGRLPDWRVGSHPYAGGDRGCDLPGCGRPADNPIHDSAPAGSRLLEAAKAVARGYEGGTIIALSTNTSGAKALSLLDQALAAAGHPTRPPKASERAMAEIDRLRRDDPEAYRHLVKQLAEDLATNAQPESLIDRALAPERTADGTSAVLDDYQNRGQ